MVCSAIQFRCDATLEELCERLNDLGPWTWMLRDSHWYGDYLYAAPSRNVRVRVLEPMDGHGPPYTIQVNKEGWLGPSQRRLARTVEELLDKIGAEDIEAGEAMWD